MWLWLMKMPSQSFYGVPDAEVGVVEVLGNSLAKTDSLAIAQQQHLENEGSEGLSKKGQGK